MGWFRWGSMVAGVLPDACVACDEVLSDGQRSLCEGCLALTLEVAGPSCGRCGEPGAFHAGLCPRCRVSPPPFRSAWAPFEHEGAVARAIHRFKYEDRSDLSRPLAGLVATGQRKVGGTLVPVPLHEARFRQRRYDQAALLAVALGRLWRQPVALEWLERVRHTTRQVGLDEAGREANVAGAFRAPRVEGAVVLVDDVFTTGATAREATKVLLEAGASEVRVITVARARRENLARAPYRLRAPRR